MSCGFQTDIFEPERCDPHEGIVFQSRQLVHSYGKPLLGKLRFEGFGHGFNYGRKIIGLRLEIVFHRYHSEEIRRRFRAEIVSQINGDHQHNGIFLLSDGHFLVNCLDEHRRQVNGQGGVKAVRRRNCFLNGGYALDHAQVLGFPLFALDIVCTADTFALFALDLAVIFLKAVRRTLCA